MSLQCVRAFKQASPVCSTCTTAVWSLSRDIELQATLPALKIACCLPWFFQAVGVLKKQLKFPNRKWQKMRSSPSVTAVRARDQAALTPGLPSTEVRRRFLLPWRKWFVGVRVLAYPSQVACIQQGCHARIWQWKRDVHFPAGHSNVFQQCGLAIGNGTCYWKYLRRNAMVVSVLHALECLSIIMLLLTFKRSCIVLSQTKDAKLLSPSWHPTESTSKTPNDKKEHDITR